MPVVKRRSPRSRNECDLDHLSFLATGITPDADHEWGRYWNLPIADIPADVLADMRDAWNMHRDTLLRQYAGHPQSRPLWAEHAFGAKNE